MNRLSLSLSSAICCLSLSTVIVSAQSVEPQPRPSHTDLIKKRTENNTQNPKIEDAPAKIFEHKERSLIGNSTLLSDGTNWTLIPKGAIISIPERLKSKIVTKPVGNLIEWRFFLTKNSSWLHTYPVQMKEAQGKMQLNRDRLKQLALTNKIVVATCANGPISVAPEAFPPPEDDPLTLK